MTATVAEDAGLNFVTPSALNSLLKQRPDLCRVVLAMLRKIIAENNEQQQRLLKGDEDEEVSPKLVRF